jgi:hypothetical protein
MKQINRYRGTPDTFEGISQRARLQRRFQARETPSPCNGHNLTLSFVELAELERTYRACGSGDRPLVLLLLRRRGLGTAREPKLAGRSSASPPVLNASRKCADDPSDRPSLTASGLRYAILHLSVAALSCDRQSPLGDLGHDEYDWKSVDLAHCHRRVGCCECCSCGAASDRGDRRQ